MSHANARLTVHGRRTLVERVLAGWPQAHVAEQLGVSRETVRKWWARYLAEGWDGLADRCSRPRTSPSQVTAKVEAKVLAAREKLRRGPIEIGAELGMPASTVGKILARNQVPLLRCLDPITGEVVKGSRRPANRYEHKRPGDLIHVDVKKAGRIPTGGGWRLHGRDATVAHRHKKIRLGYDYIHTAIDDHSRVVYSEIHPDEKDATCAGFLARALAFFRDLGVRVRRILTDNALVYRRGSCWKAVCSAFELKRRFTKPGCPWTNGKAERYNRTLLIEWLYARPWNSNAARARGLATFQHRYNNRRRHTALGGRSPMSRIAA